MHCLLIKGRKRKAVAVEDVTIIDGFSTRKQQIMPNEP